MTAPHPCPSPAALAPRLRPGEVRVRIHGVGLREDDASPAVRQALPAGLRSGIAGIVEGVGVGVGGDDGEGRFAVGDAVFGVGNPRLMRPGDARAVVQAGRIARMPRGLGFADAAALPLAAACAWRMLVTLGRLEAGETVAILGADSDVGAIALQLARAFGLRALAVALAVPGRAPALRTLGADEVVDASPGAIEAACARAALVVDTLGGRPQVRAAFALGSGCLLLSCVREPDMSLALQAGARGAFVVPEVTARCLARIAALVDDGLLRADLAAVPGLAALAPVRTPVRSSELAPA